MCNIDIKYNYFCKDTLFQMEYNIYVYAKQNLFATAVCIFQLYYR